jgi:trigger factor
VKVSAERIPQSQVVLEIEVEPERVEKAVDAAYQRLASRTNVPGFRKGKAPRAMIERYLGRDTLLQEALDRLVPEVYREAVEGQEIDPVELPQVEMVSTEPLIMKATVPVRPTVELGDYQGMWIPRDPVAVLPEQVDEAIEQLRHRYANLQPVDRPSKWGDVLTASVAISADSRTLLDQKNAQFQLREDATVFLPGLAEKLVGREKGKEEEIEISLPEDFGDPALAGKPCRCRVLVHEIKEEELLPLDDGFARQVGEGFPTLEKLRERLAADIREAEEQSSLESYRSQIITALEESAQVDYPPILVEREIDRLLREQLGPPGDAGGLERFLRRVGKTEEQLREELRPTAEQRLRRSLLLSKVAEVENIEIGDSEVDEEIERMTSSAGPRAEEVRRLFDNPDGRDAIRGSLFTRKTWDRLVSIVSADKPAAVLEGETPTESAESSE